MHFAPSAWAGELVAELQRGTVLRGHAGIEILAEFLLPSSAPLSRATSAGEEGMPFLMCLPRVLHKQAVERPYLANDTA